MKKVIVLSIIASIFISCNKNENLDFEIVKGTISSIKSLENISLGENDTITIVFRGGDGCSQGNHLEAKVDANTISFDAYYKQSTIENQACPANIPYYTLKYIHKPEARGEILYKDADSELSTSSTVK